MGDILFCEKDNPILKERLKKIRNDGCEMLFLDAIVVFVVALVINQNGVVAELLLPFSLLLFIGTLFFIIGIADLFGSTALCITEEGITLPGLPLRDIVKRKGFFLAWEDVGEVIYKLNRVHHEYGVLGVIILWIRTRAGRLYPIGITDVVDEEKFIEVMKEICRRKEVKYIESAFPPTRIFRKAYAKQFET